MPARVLVPVAVGVGAAALALADGRSGFVGAPIGLLAAAAVAEFFPVPIQRVDAGATSFAPVFIVAAGVLYGWQPAALVGALTIVLAALRRRTAPARVLSHSALYALAGAAAGLAAQPLAGRLEGALLAAAVFYVVDIILLAAVVAHARGTRYPPLVRDFFVSTFAPFVVVAVTTAIFVQLWGDAPWVAFLLLPPLVAIVAYQRSFAAALERQRELDRLKDEFIAVASHELRTPITSLYGSAVTLERDDLDPETRERLMTIIRSESARLSKLVDDVLWASRLDAQSQAVPAVACDPAQLLRELVAAHAAVAPESIELDFEADSTVPDSLPADADRLRRVLSNLLENAIKYSPDGGRVVAGVRMVGDRLRFSVTDEGLGIPEAERERVFEKFLRLDPRMTRGIGGTGLGLYISRELVRQLGGRIWIAPTEGRGSSFEFEIPCAVDAGTDDLEEAPVARARRGAGRWWRRLEPA